MDDSFENGASVFVPGITAPSSVACLRSLAPRGIRTIVGAESPETPAAASAHCDAFVRVPDPATDLAAYGEALYSIAARPSVRTIIPVREADAYVLTANRDRFAAEIGTPWPDAERLERVQDRVELFEAAEAAGVAIPDTAPVDEWDDWNRETIIKPRYSVAAPEYLDPDAEVGDVGSTVYWSPGARPDLEACRREWGHLPLAQEYVPDSREFGFFALYDEGEPVATFQHCQRRGYKYSGGPSSYRESVDIPELERDGRALLDELDWHGLAMVEFLRDTESGEFKLMEVNPRFWSSLPFTVRAGADFPYYYWQLATGQPVTAPREYAVGMGGHLLRGEICHLHSILTETYPLVERPAFGTALRDVAVSLLTQPHFDYAVADDPRPFVQDSWNAIRDGLDQRVGRYLGRDTPRDETDSEPEETDGTVDRTATPPQDPDSRLVAQSPARGDGGDRAE